MLFKLLFPFYYFFGKNKTRELFDGCRVYISDNFPFFGQGIYCGLLGCFINRVEYTNGTYGYLTDLEDLKTKRHEVLGHHFQRFTMGFWRFWYNIVKDYLNFKLPHDKKPMEQYPNKVEGE